MRKSFQGTQHLCPVSPFPIPPAISAFAIIVDPKDNVAVVKTETWPGLEVSLPDGRVVQVTERVAPDTDLQLGRFRKALLSCNTGTRLALRWESRRAR